MIEEKSAWRRGVAAQGVGTSMRRSLLRLSLFLVSLIALLGEVQSASALSSIMALPRIITSPPIARRPMTRIVEPWRVNGSTRLRHRITTRA